MVQEYKKNYKMLGIGYIDFKTYSKHHKMAHPDIAV